MKRIAIAFTPVLMFSAPLAAEPTVDFSGQVRAREELRHELFSPTDPLGEESGDEAHLRSRVRADATISDQLGVVVELQDVRILGSEGSTIADTEGVDLKRGYILIASRDSKITAKVGRWVMQYGDGRFIGHLEWVDQGRSYNGVTVSYKPNPETFVDAFAVRVRETLDADDDLHFGGVYAGFGVAPGANLEVYVLGLRDAMPPNTTFATVGTRFDMKRGLWDATAEAAVQVGEVGDAELFAFGGAVEAGVIVNEERTIRLGAELAYASGDDDFTDDDDRTFRTLFPTNHFHYGHADLVALQNILAIKAQVSAKPTATTKASLDLHHFRLAEAAGGWFNAGGALIRPGDPDASQTLGHEIDLGLGWDALDGLNVSGGLALFIGGGFVDDTGGGSNALFGYVQTRAKF